MNKKIIFGSMFLLVGNVWATVTASIDRNQVSVGQSFTLTINLPDSGDTPELDVLKNNFDLYDTASSSQTSIINGKISSQNTFTVNLIPKISGKQVIPAIKVGNEMTNPINIEVLPETTVPKGDASKNSSVYLDASVNKQNLYIGVPFLYTIKLYFSVPLANLNLEQISLNGAQIEPHGKSTQYQSVEDGKTYQVVEQQFLITPNKAGNLTIPPARVKGSIADNGGNGLFPMMANKPFIANSKPVNLQIKAVPNSIPPTEWLPAKQLKVSDSWSQNTPTIKAGEPLTHTITLEAQGIPATSIPELQLQAINGVNAYPDKPQSNTNGSNGNLIGIKTFKIAYIPTKQGSLTFPEIKIKWWDINSDSLKTAIIPAKVYNVIADPNVAGTTPTLLMNASEATKMTAKPDEPRQVSLLANIWFYVSLLFAGLWLITLMIAYRLYKNKPVHKQHPTQLIDGNPDGKNNSTKIDNKQIIIACKNQDILALNKALLEWARQHSGKAIYTLMDIKPLFKNDSLNSLLDSLSATIYKNEPFNQFNEVVSAIDNIKIVNPLRSNELPLKELYPN